MYLSCRAAPRVTRPFRRRGGSANNLRAAANPTSQPRLAFILLGVPVVRCNAGFLGRCRRPPNEYRALANLCPGMASAGQSLDRLNVAQEIATRFNNESVVWSDVLVKRNRLGSRQLRAVVITNASLFNFLPRNYAAPQRQLGLADIDELWLLPGSELGSLSCEELSLRNPGHHR